MTEAEWLAATDPKPMLAFVRGAASDRKLRLWTVRCCRVLWHLFHSPQHRDAVGIAERYADGGSSDDELASAHKACDDGRPSEDLTYFFVGLAASQATLRRMAEGIALEHPLLAAASFTGGGACLCDDADTLRDIFGNPFRPVTAEQSWVTSDVWLLATGIYEDRAFDRLPILADALMDAGCDNVDILNHCRLPCEHVRGCWVVDLLLGKK